MHSRSTRSGTAGLLLARRAARAAEVREQDLEARALERRRAGDELEQHAAERVEIRARVDDLAVRLLGRHVVRRADQAVRW